MQVKNCTNYTEPKYKKYYAYIGQQSDLKYNNIEFISKYINNVQESDIDYETKLWLNLHKTVNSGLHRDPNSKIMYVLKGQKKVYLLPPHNSEDAYIKVFNTVNKISNNNEYNTKSNTLEKKIIKFYSL